MREVEDGVGLATGDSGPSISRCTQITRSGIGGEVDLARTRGRREHSPRVRLPPSREWEGGGTAGRGGVVENK